MDCHSLNRYYIKSFPLSPLFTTLHFSFSPIELSWEKIFRKKMIIINNVLVSDEVVEKQFVCDLAKCKGRCCEDGDAGAPLEKEELDIIVDLYETIKPYLTEAAIKEIER